MNIKNTRIKSNKMWIMIRTFPYQGHITQGERKQRQQVKKIQLPMQSFQLLVLTKNHLTYFSSLFWDRYNIFFFYIWVLLTYAYIYIIIIMGASSNKVWMLADRFLCDHEWPLNWWYFSSVQILMSAGYISISFVVKLVSSCQLFVLLKETTGIHVESPIFPNMVNTLLDFWLMELVFTVAKSNKL